MTKPPSDKNIDRAAVQVTPEMEDAIARIREIRDEKKRLTSEEETAKDVLLDLIGDDHDVVLKKGEQVLGTVYESLVTGTDWKKLRADHPDLPYDQYNKEPSVSTTIRIT
ncbi:hypothetical protein SEA_GODONK_103 [Gordonia phage GodonK]|uniref:Uncharacterized protein n=1 Tax=Gordonia phage GodonK TaxID=2562192 RepID=A0A4D6E3V2_9CAUD|nr:hypothetical protein HOV33_gp103 [Gordonia phage GodonK]QBZ72722.1 hypothetical protein SEA_GODONK_103 [Gordonia phage GodonK]